jgi:threonine dehydrogenase-like Zn-dependent dehydrogenase
VYLYTFDNFANARFRGMRGSSRADLEAVCAFLEAKNVKVESIIDKVFTFEEAPEAYKYLATGKHIGKVVIKVS